MLFFCNPLGHNVPSVLAATPVSDPESLLSEHLPVAKKVACEAKRRFPQSDFNENLSVAMNAMWEAAQKWNGKDVFEKFFRCVFNRRLKDSFRKELGRTARLQERRGSKVERVNLDREIDGKPVSEMVSVSPVALGSRFSDLAEEIRRLEWSVSEEVVAEMVLLQERPAKDAALALGVTAARVSQIRLSVVRRIRQRLSR